MLRLGPERKAIVLAGAGQSYTERNIAQVLRSTFPINLGVIKEFVHVMYDCDEPLLKSSRCLMWTLERETP